jgi:hypothetical protein
MDLLRRLIAIVLCCFGGRACAETWPTFELTTSTWHATHVAVIDASGVVLESWKGDLKSGARIPVEQWNLPTRETVYYGRSGPEPGPDDPKLPMDAVREVTNARRVFFLKRKGDGDIANAATWAPALLFGSEMSLAVAWLANGEAFGIRDRDDHYPPRMRPMRLNEAQVKSVVRRLVELQQGLHKAARDPDPVARAERMVSFLRPDERLAFLEAIEVMKGCGKPAWGVVRRLLTQEEFLPIHHDLVHVAMHVAGTEAIGEVERIVREESQYWASVVRSGERPVEYNPPMSWHFSRLASSLNVLMRLDYRDPNGIVAKLRADWEADPRLAHLGSGGNNERSPVLKYADEILKPR